MSVVQVQRESDPDFSTVKSPNPEDAEVFALALAQARPEPVDLIMATDPDADRLGVMRAAAGTLPPNAAIIKTIATSNIVLPICQPYGATVIDTHTGFKYIGDKMQEYEQTGSQTFLFVSPMVGSSWFGRLAPTPS